VVGAGATGGACAEAAPPSPSMTTTARDEIRIEPAFRSEQA
jgi:hypothetical protein